LLVCSAENSLERQVAFAATLMDRSEIPDRMETILAGGAMALLGHSDFPAGDALSWCSRNGVDIPGQMAIVGIGNLRHAQEPEPVKTTVRKDFKRMADLALEILLQRMEVRRGSEWRRETIDVDLLVRSTCGAPGQADRPRKP
jgi:DNA-binding LacI/PurR family transcriptional regulator